jgi:hypothetical protein
MHAGQMKDGQVHGQRMQADQVYASQMHGQRV